jgi:CheY-like chemotaxis protein
LIPAPALLVCDCVSWRLDLFEKALDRITDAVRQFERLSEVRLGYRVRDDIAILVIEEGLLSEQRLGVLAASAGELPGLRALDLPADGPPAAHVRDRLLDSCDVVTSALAVTEAVARIRAVLGMTDDRRRSQRLAVDVACRYQVGDRWTDATARDLSSAGVFIATSTPAPEVGSRPTVELFPESDTPITVEVEVVRHTPDGFGARLALDEEAQRLIYDRVRLLRPETTAPGGGAGPRIPVQLDVSFLLGGELRHEALENLSQGGAFIRSAEPPAPGTALQLDLKMAGGESLTLQGDVVRVVAAKPGPLPGGFGIAFRRLGEKTSAQLDRFISDSLTRPFARILVGLGADGDEVSAGLKKRRCEVVTGEDATDVFELLLGELLGLDLLLLNERLPGSSAPEMLHRIRRLGGELDLPVAVVSTRADQDRKMLMEAGATAVIQLLPADELAARCVELIMARRRLGSG